MSRLSAVIRGTGSSLPEKVVTNFDLEKLVETSDEWIATRTGIRERRVAREGETMSQFAVQASVRALEMANTPAAAIDLIICATVTPDMPIPSTACIIQHRLGATRAAAFDLSAGCSGFTYALSIADQFIRSGTYRNVLVIGAELLTKYLDWSDRTTCILFADGAGAVVLTGEETDGRGIVATAIHADGSMADYITLPGGGTLHPPTAESVRSGLHFIRMKGNETFKLAVRSIEEVCREVLAAAGVTAAEVDLFVPHQANRRIIDAVGSRLGMPPEKVYLNIERTGNTSSASIPIALDEANRKNLVHPGDRVLFAAFGAGLTWGAALVRW
ncbi:MAG TPA: beta-ketoacyl-ACP synthase III [Verrucomicrobiae bacterium]|nr:beta-ketoacyl-ACP synthase III [Verrucomicrobiae bacterium]